MIVIFNTGKKKKNVAASDWMMLSCLVVLRALYIRVKGRGHDDDNQQEVRTKYKNSFSNMQQLAACVEQTTTRYNRFKALFLMSTPSSAFGLFLSFLFISMCVCVCVYNVQPQKLL